MYLNKSESIFCYCLNAFDTADVTTFKEDNKQLNRQTMNVQLYSIYDIYYVRRLQELKSFCRQKYLYRMSQNSLDGRNPKQIVKLRLDIKY